MLVVRLTVALKVSIWVVVWTKLYALQIDHLGMAQTYAKHLSHSFVISSAINPKTLLHGSHVFFSNFSTKGPTGPPKMLL